MSRKKSIFPVLVTGSLLLAACSNLKEAMDSSTKEQSSIQTYESQTITEDPRPQDDFYTHVNYKFLTETALPDGLSSFDNLANLGLESKEQLKTLLKELVDNYDNLEEGSDEKKVVDFYKMALNFKQRDKEGFKPIEGYLHQIKSATTLSELNRFMVENLTLDYAPFLNLGIAPDTKDNTRNSLTIGPSSVGLSEEYYKDNEYSVKVQNAYKDFLKNSFVLMGYTEKEATRKAGIVYDFEKDSIAKNLTAEEKVDINKQYNERSFEEVYELTSNLPFKEAFEKYGLDQTDKVIVTDPKGIKHLNNIYTEENFEAIQSIIEMQVVRSNLNNLSKDLLETVAEYGEVYTGFKHIESDEDLAYNLTTSTFSNVIGKLYIEKYFTPETKQDIESMTQEILATYRERLDSVDWLEDDTKELAKRKLDTLTVKVGYPEEWEDYSSVIVKPADEGGNLVQISDDVKRIKGEEALAKLNEAPDKSKWAMDVYAANAYYSPTANEIVFPAGILQSPLYSPEASRAENLGGIGSVIGHEISHAFDSTGAQFDENGNLNNWWTEEDNMKFQEKVKQAADIYSKLEVVKGHFVNGEISTGEIMADLGGLTVVLDIAKREGLDTKEVFESYAKAWRGVNTKEALISNLTDEHPPNKFRINNIVNLMDQFYVDYDVKESDKMYVKPEDRLTVW